MIIRPTGFAGADVLEAFRFLGWLFSLSARQVTRLKAAYHGRWIQIDRESGALTAPMLPRKERKARAKEIGIPFRPVYGYRGIPAEDHKMMIASMKANIHGGV